MGYLTPFIILQRFCQSGESKWNYSLHKSFSLFSFSLFCLFVHMFVCTHVCAGVPLEEVLSFLCDINFPSSPMASSFVISSIKSETNLAISHCLTISQENESWLQKADPAEKMVSDVIQMKLQVDTNFQMTTCSWCIMHCTWYITTDQMHNIKSTISFITSLFRGSLDLYIIYKKERSNICLSPSTR